MYEYDVDPDGMLTYGSPNGSAARRRQTTFASVDVMPDYPDEEITINENDLEIDTYRSGGAGGQHVNTTDSAVRITHVPSGIIVACQNERSQHKNRRTAMKMLMARLVRMQEMSREAEIAKLYGEKGEISWGNQIRSYTLQPFQLVKDHRTDHQTSNSGKVLDGDLDPFIEAYLRHQAEKRATAARAGTAKSGGPKPAGGGGGAGKG